MATSAPPPPPPRKRTSDLGPRRRRAANVEALRATVAVLEAAVPVVLSLDVTDDDDDDDSVLWEDLLGPKAMRVRTLMRRSLELTKEAQRLVRSKNRVKQLLWEHQVASRVLAGLVQEKEETPADDWAASLKTWSRLTRLHFRPWTREECRAEVDSAVHELHQLLSRSDMQSSGVSFLGWRERRRIDPVTRSLHFVYQKVFPGYGMMQYVQALWDSYTDSTTLPTARPQLRRTHSDIIQQISPTICIVRHDEQYTPLGVDGHALHLLWRTTDSARSFTMCVRTLDVPAIQRAINGPRDLWTTSWVWLHWEALDDTLRDYRLSICGKVAGGDIAFAEWWLAESLASLIRRESAIMQRPLLRAQ